MTSSLFRPEVIQQRSRRIDGEVVLGQPFSTRAIVAALAAIIVALGLWLALGTFARIETARGMLVTVAPSVKVVGHAPGIVAALFVEEGARVHKGDRLVVVTLDKRAADGEELAGRSLAALRARMSLIRSQVRIEGARLAGERSRLTASLAAAKSEAAQLSDQIAIQLEMVASNKKLVDQIGPVVDRGFVSRNEFERRRQALLSARQGLAALRQQHDSALSRAEQSRAELMVLENQSAAQVEALRSGSLELTQQEVQLQGEQSYVLLAPIDGIVTALQTAQGRTAIVGAPLMTIVPEGANLRAEVYAPSRAVGLVKVGQEARLLYDAFPYQHFGSFRGRVAAVSRIAIDPRENETPLSAQEPVYRVTIALHRQSVDAFGTVARLQPGMAVTANLVLERQSFFAWLLTPLRAVMNRTQ